MNTQSDPKYLFVYGTLRPGRAPASVAPVIDGCRCLGGGCTPGRLYDLGSYPGAVLDEACDERIHGQLVEIPDDAVLARLDLYEGYDPADPARSLFLRTACDVTTEDGRVLRAWAYVYNRAVANARPVAGGRYDR